jgi:hypothetical protein
MIYDSLKLKRFLKVIDNIFVGLHNTLHGVVIFFFKNINRKVRSKIPVWKMESETSEHVHLAINVFKKIIFPASLFYVCANFYFFGRNSLDSMLLGMVIFFYSNFLPDLSSVFKKKKNSARSGGLSWCKKYALLLLAPLFMLSLFSGLRLAEWKITETFHDFKSLSIYGAFLLLLGFFLFGNFPMSIGRLNEILSPSVYGVVGYLTHLKVDKIW